MFIEKIIFWANFELQKINITSFTNQHLFSIKKSKISKMYIFNVSHKIFFKIYILQKITKNSQT